jgi:hypothetical protein
MNARRSRAAALAALIAAAVAATAAVPAASAAPAPIVGGGSFARTIPFIDGNIVEFECHAAAPGALSTTVSSCVLNSVFGPVAAPESTSPGPAAATSQGVSLAPANYQVCWTVSAGYSDGSTQASSGCSSSGTLVGAG